MTVRGMMKWFTVGALALGAAGLVAPLTSAQGDAQKLYTAKCASCHGADGTANTPVGKALKTRDFHSPDVQKESDADLTAIVTKGKNKMPAFEGKLKDTEIKSLVEFVRALGKK